MSRNLLNHIGGWRSNLFAGGLLLGTCAVLGINSDARANDIDVLLSRTAGTGAATDSYTNGTGSVAASGNTNNNGITPGTYTPTLTTIAYAPSTTYDAADTADSGTQWNTLFAPVNAVNNATGVNVTTVYQQNVSLFDSSGNSTNAQLSLSFTEPTGKNDKVSNSGIVAASNPGTDGLSPNPAALMNQAWFDNSTSEIITFGLTGLTPGAKYNLFVYGAGTTYQYGGTYTVPTANQGTGYSTASGAYTTETGTSSSQIYRSVFDWSGTNPTPELSLTWTELPVVADASGDLSFSTLKDVSTGIKGSINGFQLDAVPEPASLSLLGICGCGLLRRRPRRA